jgi:hypothetical protein
MAATPLAGRIIILAYWQILGARYYRRRPALKPLVWNSTASTICFIE